jgi:hypothetical protein
MKIQHRYVLIIVLSLHPFQNLLLLDLTPRSLAFVDSCLHAGLDPFASGDALCELILLIRLIAQVVKNTALHRL